MFNPNDFRKDFPILNQKVYGKDLVYLDSAATSQKPNTVIDAEAELYRTINSNIHRGIHFLANECTTAYESARQKVANFIGTQSENVVFTSGATASINIIAHSFAELMFTQGDNIIVTRMEHHANIVPWQMVAGRYNVEIRVWDFNEDGTLQMEKLETLIDDRTQIIAITHISNVLGTVNPIKDVVQLAHSRGVAVAVDGCQGAVHKKVNVEELDVDFYCFSAHKIYGPTGVGIMYGKKMWLEKIPPFLGGGDMIKNVSLETGATWADVPLKFEAGTTNYIGAITFGMALDFLDSYDFDEMENHANSLAADFTERLLKIEGARVYGLSKDKVSIVSFTIEGTHPMDIAQIADKMGVAMRSGTHCAEPIMKHYGHQAMCRASFAPYNTAEDVDKAIEAIERAVRMLRQQ